MPNQTSHVIEGPTVLREDPRPAAAPGLNDYLRVLLRYRTMIVVLVAVAVLASTVYVVARAPVYRTEMTLQVEPRAPEYGAVQGVQQSADEDTFYQTQYAIIGSRAVAERVVAELSPEQAGKLLQSPTWFEWMHPEPGPVNKDEHRKALVQAVRNGLSVHGLKDSQLVKLNYTAPTPELSAEVGNLIAQSYIDLQNEAQVRVTEQAHDWLNSQLDKLRADLEESEKRLQRYKEEHGLLASENLDNLASQRLSGTSQKLLDARADRMEAEVLYEQTQEAKSQGGVDALVPVLNNPTVQQLKLRQNEAQRELEELRTHYGDNAPKVQQARAKVNQVTQRLQAEVANAVQSIEKRYQAAVEREEDLRASSEELDESIREQSSEEYNLAKLEREVEVNRNLFETFLDRVKETSLASQLSTNNIRVIDSAVPPNVPVAPNPQRAVGLALILSVFLGIALAFLRQNLNRTFRTPQDLETLLQLPGIGVLPKLDARRNRDMYRHVAREPRSPFAEAMGEIRTRLQVSRGEDKPQVILVTSAVPGEGKSTLSSNLASAYGQLGKTLLLDADLRKSSLRALGKRKGLTDLVAGAEPEKCFARSSRDSNLYVLSSGSRRVNPQEFLSSQATAALFQQLRRRFDTIIVDTAPVLAVSDALILGRYVDGVVLSVKAASTPFDVVHDCVRRLRSASIPVLGVTLSQVDLNELLRDGGYAYGHY